MIEVERTPYTADIESKWRHGCCYQMACAMSDFLGWPIESLVVDFANRNGPVNIHFVHAWVIAPDGRTFDAGGYFEKESLFDEFLNPGRLGWSNNRYESFVGEEEFLCRLGVAYSANGAHGDWPEFLVDYVIPQKEKALVDLEGYIIPRHLPDYSLGMQLTQKFG